MVDYTFFFQFKIQNGGMGADRTRTVFFIHGGQDKKKK